jgi:ASC-1-like (ASCH) protein
MHHTLKIRKAFFEAVLSGDKTFEIRDNRDRGFQRGDTFVLVEMSDTAPSSVKSGRTFEGVITYVLNYEQKEGFVVFSFKPT